MKVLMISEKDAANVSLAKISEAFLRHGHSVELYAPYYDENVLKHFPESIERKPLQMLTAETIDSFDIIFSSVVAGAFVEQTGILLTKKVIFTQNYLIDKQIAWGGDYCFVASAGTAHTAYESYFDFEKLAAGEPKYDRTAKEISEKKQFLFIDSGHFPFGELGKRELARTLLSICERFPEYRLVIKPRFLPGDKIRTHQNKLSIDQVLRQEGRDGLPANLQILTEHRDLQELIAESHTVICMYTTAFSGAVLADKGLVILDHLPSEDTYDLREKILFQTREQMEGSGALVDYREALHYLPHGIKANSGYKNFLFARENDSAEFICRKTECLAKKAVDWDECILRRYRDYLVYRTFIHLDFHAKVRLDIRRAYGEIERFVDTYVRDGLRSPKADFHERVAAFSLGLRNRCILENGELFRRDPIDAGIYLNALYLTGHFAEIMEFPEDDTGAVQFFKGMTAFQRGRLNEAKDRLLKFADQTLCRDYIKEISDMSDNRRRGMETLICLLEQSGDNRQAEAYRERWQP
ncbi:MAG: hypothetical protein HFI64_02100 [Lachnospiraceae bacterium]|nr:hypothetical protein [Lachnospiraceae bacterium]